jgi:hypothetical protein
MTVAVPPLAPEASPPAPLPLRVAGGPRELGIQQGAALASEIRATADVLLGSDAFALLRPRLVPRRIFEAMARARGARLLAGPVARARPEQHARILGIADGAGVSPRTIWLVHAGELLLASVDWRRRPPPLASCSTLAVRGARARDGVAVHHAFDYPAVVRPFLFVRETRPARGHASVELSVAPIAGVVDGVNDAGLAIATNYAFTTDAASAVVPNTLAVGAALERCATTAEAVDFLSRHPRGGGGLLMIADRSGDVVSLELSSTRTAVRAPAPGEDALLHTNLLATDALREVEIPRDASYSDRNVAAVRGLPVHRSAELRQAALARRVAARPGPLATSDLLEIFSDHGATPGGDDDSLCRHGPYWTTAATIQLVPRERRLRIAFDAPCRSPLADVVL